MRALPAVLALVVLAACTPPSRAGQDLALGAAVLPSAERTPLGALAGTTLTGRRLALRSVVGQGVVAVNVWASWCAPCRREMPVLARAHGNGLRVLGIDERDRAGRARAFAAAAGARYPSLQDPQGRLLARLHSLPQQGVPSTVFLDGRGRTIARYIGPLDDRALRTLLNRIGRKP